jgi:hypothetical protein
MATSAARRSHAKRSAAAEKGWETMRQRGDG